MPTKSTSIFEIAKTYDDLFDIAHEAQTALRLLAGNVPALSNEELIERGLLLAKTNPTEQEVAVAMLYYGFMELEHKIAKGRPGLDPLVPALMWAKAKKQRQRFRARLEELMRSPAKVKKKHQLADIKTLQQHLLIIQSVNDQGRLEQRFYPRTIEAAYTHVLVLLYLGENEQRWHRLRGCPHCRSYFLRKASKAGGRPRDYCTPECQKKADQQKALIRQKAARKQK